VVKTENKVAKEQKEKKEEERCFCGGDLDAMKKMYHFQH
jgi:hypothetical protein